MQAKSKQETGVLIDRIGYERLIYLLRKVNGENRTPPYELRRRIKHKMLVTGSNYDGIDKPAPTAGLKEATQSHYFFPKTMNYHLGIGLIDFDGGYGEAPHLACLKYVYGILDQRPEIFTAYGYLLPTFDHVPYIVSVQTDRAGKFGVQALIDLQRGTGELNHALLTTFGNFATNAIDIMDRFSAREGRELFGVETK